ncbi:MAG: DUF721 domain-containing protein [Verrucomicrobiales bacterium]|nr:DUF721 domain-containing protein [Verrucomicrobiales bacterium]
MSQLPARPPFLRRNPSWDRPLDARQSVLAEWRGMDLTPLEREQAQVARPAGDLLRSVLKRVGLDERRTSLQIQRVWAQSLDPNLVAHARPAGLHKGTLFVHVDSSAWLDEIVRYRRREILTRLQHALGSSLIQRLSFRLG